jgi:polysaccharide biosynthesis transport protein
VHRSAVHADKTFTVEAALDVWRRRKWIALLVFAAVFGAVGSVARALPDLYRATTSVIVERQQVSEAFVRPSVTAELETRIQTIREQVMSRARLSDLIARLNLYPEMRRRAPIDAVVERMRRDIQLELKGIEQPLSGRMATIAFTISYSGREPRTVATVANALAALYVDENTKIREGQAVGTAEFLRAQLNEAKKDLDAQERRASDYKLTHMGELPQQVEANLASLERLNTQLRLNGENQIRAEDRRERLEKQLAETPSVSAAPARATSPDVDRLAKAKHQLEELRGKFTDEYPDVVRLKAEVAALEKSSAPSSDVSAAPVSVDARAHLTQSVADVNAELRSLKDEERALRQAIMGYEQRVENAPKRQQEFQELSRGSDTIKERYESLMKRYEEAQLAESLEQGQKMEQFRVLDPAIPPRVPAAPNRMRLFVIGFILAIGLATAAVYAAEKVNTSFHSIDDVRNFVAIPTLVRVPMIRSRAEIRWQRLKLAFVTVSAIAGLLLLVAASHYVATGNEEIVRMIDRGHA